MTAHLDTALATVVTTSSAAVGWVGAKAGALLLADANGYSLSDLGQGLAGTGGVIIFGILAVRFLLKDRDTQALKLEKLEAERLAMAEKLMQVVSNNTAALENNKVQFQQVCQAMERHASAINLALGELHNR